MAEVIVALDVVSPREALQLADQLPELRWAKIGPMLFVRGGPDLVRQLKARGVCVFLDLKWHDIPNSVAEAVRGAAEQGVDLATVHALGGRAMLEAAARASDPMRLAAVSVLTSHSASEYWETLGRRDGAAEVQDEVVRLARIAVEAGVHGVVASPLEVTVVKEVVGPDRWIVVPGIRPPGTEAGDQRRTATPEVAVAAGATHLVVGRPIIRAERPRLVYDSICEAIA